LIKLKSLERGEPNRAEPHKPANYGQ